jgi:hypothetical protein
MDFPNALKMLKMNVPMYRTSWKDENPELYITLKDDIFWSNSVHRKPLPIVFNSTMILADDWEVRQIKSA